MKSTIQIREITLVGLAAALMGVFSQLSIPLPTVPLTLQVFGAILLATVLEKKLAVLGMIIYILIGGMGIPVFSNFGRGLGVLIGPTGGYILGFVVLAAIVGKGAEQNNKKILLLSAYIGLIADYVIGTIQLKIVTGLTIQGALAAGVYPFIIKDLILTWIAVECALQIKKRLGKVLSRQMSY